MVVWSTLAHLGALGLVFVAPGDTPHAPPRVISVELVAPPNAAPSRAKPAPAPAAQPPPPKAEPEPAPEPEPIPTPPEPPPPPKPKQIVLPEKTSEPKPKEKPEPKKDPESKPREKREVFKEPPKKEEKSLEELMAELRGESDASPTPIGTDEPVETAAAPTPGATSGTGDPLSAEERDWHARVIRKMKGIWVVPPGFRTQPLETHVMVSLDAEGNILGEARITRRSGNPWYDESVLRGLTKASPLPPPPEAGDWPMVFEPSDSL